MNKRVWLVLLIVAALLQPVHARDEDVGDRISGPAADSIYQSTDTAYESDQQVSETVTSDTAENVSSPAPIESEPASVSNNDTDIVVVKETLDTVFIFDKSVFRHVAQDWRKNIDIFRQRGYGLSGGMYYGANAIMVRPVRNLVENYPKFNSEKFRFSKYGVAPMLVSGGTGYIGLGDGFRLGGGGMSGEAQFDCKTSDTITLSTKISYGGFLVEKAILFNRWNLSIGGMLGGGNVDVSLTESDFFEWNDLNDEDEGSGEKAVFFLFEPHIGLTYTILYFFHIGANITLPTFMSLDKFNPYTDDFITVNPGLHIKLLFGNLG
jgi:hypothetical protein